MSPVLHGNGFGGTPSCGAGGLLDGGHPLGTLAPHRVALRPYTEPRSRVRKATGGPSTKEVRMDPLGMDGVHEAKGCLSTLLCWRVPNALV